MTHFARVFVPLVSLAAGSTVLHAQLSTLLNDTFGDSDRTTQNMPEDFGKQ